MPGVPRAVTPTPNPDGQQPKLIHERLREAQERGISMGRIAAASATSPQARDGVTEKTLYTILATPGSTPALRILRGIARGLGDDVSGYYEYPIALARETPEQAERRAAAAARKAAQRARKKKDSES